MTKAESATPFEIDMPDDDGKAMEIVCSLVHLKNDSFSADIPSQLVLRIAVLADKYDCIGALRLAAELWLNCSHTRSYTMPKSCIRSHYTFAASFLFRNAKAFKEHGRRLILECSTEISAPLNPEFDVVREVLSK